MRNSFIILAVLFTGTFISCKQNEVSRKDKSLLAFKMKYVAELGDDVYDKFSRLVEKKKIEKKFIDDIIYISYYEEINACGQYDGDVTIKGDSIILKLDLVSDEVCTSTLISKVTYIVDNPDSKKKIILKE